MAGVWLRDARSAGLGEGYDVRGRVCVSVGRAEFVLRV